MFETSTRNNPNVSSRHGRLRFAGVTLSVLALAGCSAENWDGPDVPVPTTPPETVTVTVPAPTPSSEPKSAENNQNTSIKCNQIVENDVMLECDATATGHYALYLKSYNKSDDRPIARYTVQDTGGTFNLIPKSPYIPYCTEGFVTLFSIPKDGTGEEHLVYNFDVCGPAKIVNN